jgi:hypothetical protein
LKEQHSLSLANLLEVGSLPLGILEMGNQSEDLNVATPPSDFLSGRMNTYPGDIQVDSLTP